MTEVCALPFGSSAYEAACALRDEVLRKPLGMALRPVDVANEEHQQTWGLYEGKRLVGCLLVKPQGEGQVQVRQYAIATDHQGQGLGRVLMKGVEAELRQQSIRHVWLHAREPVIGFYAKLGYQPVGERFLEINLPHQKMEKYLAAES